VNTITVADGIMTSDGKSYEAVTYSGSVIGYNKTE
jgi:hypothetical protein